MNKDLKISVVLREVEERDAKPLFELVNDAKVRESSFYSREISWKEHLEWFSKKFKDVNSYFLIVENDGVFAGQIRFEIKEDVALVGISIAKDYRSKDIAKTAMNMALEMFLNKCNDVHCVKAQIKKDNKVSQEFFKKCGYVYSRNVVVNGCSAEEYEYEF